ncbi:MAG: hypothetical protein DWH83_03330 [Planctomycetota bacterium]|nr:MAG: hypothetical protein DWH83_03330 [Planctomycetota bacterium]
MAPALVPALGVRSPSPLHSQVDGGISHPREPPRVDHVRHLFPWNPHHGPASSARRAKSRDLVGRPHEHSYRDRERVGSALRYCARPPFALERLSVTRDARGHASKVRYVLPRHKAANWVGSGHGRKPTRPGASVVVDLTPFEFLDRLADLVPPPRKHRHRYHGVLAPNHPLRPAVTSLTIGNVGKRQESEADGHASGGHGTGGCCDSSHEHQKPRSHDTSRIAWAKLMARVGEDFPFACPNCGGDIRLIAFRLLSECETIPGLRTLGNPRLLRTSCPRAGADPEDPHAFG